MDGLSGMSEGLHKARSGLIRVLLRVEQGMIGDIIISGDYILSPESFIDLMEKELTGIPAERQEILKCLQKFFKENKFQSPQTYPEDFAEAIMKALGKGEDEK
jgi:lipoate-protein ligase A